MLLPSDTPSLFAAVALGPTGVLQFHDGQGLLDQATLIAQAMPAPPAGNQYEIWLVNGGERLPLGILSVDGEGRGSLLYDSPQAKNLLADYGAVEVTINTGSSSDANGSDRVAYFYALPEAGLVYLRGLMVSAPTTPNQIGLIHGLAESANQLEQEARELLANYEGGNEADTRKNAEAMLNLLVGDQSQDHKDWNGDHQITNPGDGYGFLLNGDRLGYVQAVYSHADYAVNAAGSTRNIIVNGENVKICTQNLARWAPELREQLLAILNADSLSDTGPAIQRAASLADQILNGIDLNEDGNVEAVSGECGVLEAYEATYRMADMPLLPVNPIDTPTPIAGAATVSPTATSSLLVVASPTPRKNDIATNTPRVVATNPPPQPTDPPPPQPTNEPPPQPTREPKPTKDPKPTKSKP